MPKYIRKELRQTCSRYRLRRFTNDYFCDFGRLDRIGRRVTRMALRRFTHRTKKDGDRAEEIESQWRSMNRMGMPRAVYLLRRCAARLN